MSSRAGPRTTTGRRASGKRKKSALGTWVRRRTHAVAEGTKSAAGTALRSAVAAAWAFAWRLAAVGAVIFAGAVGYFHSVLPPPADLLDGRTRGSVTLLDGNGSVFAWRGDQYGGAVAPDTVSPHLLNAVIATEDKRFYRHFGVSPRGIAGAMIINIREGRGPFSGHGGSTITQQVAKLLCLGIKHDPAGGMSESEFEADCRRNTIWRKIKEIPFAVAMEIKFTKDEILAIYLNRSYLGAGATGFQAASLRYFGKPATEVGPAEAAMLAGLLAAPSRYAPTRNIAKARQRAGLIVGLMERQGYLTAEQAKAAKERPARLSAAAAARAGGYFADWIMGESPSIFTRHSTEDVVIRTTYDRKVQRAADEALSHVFKTKIRVGSNAQAAIVVMTPDGAVRAIVGGRNTEASGQFNRAASALRQTGSLFKPFVYAAALERGYRRNQIVVDEPFTVNVPGSGPWTPRNIDGEYRGKVTLAEAFADSINTIAVQVAEDVGRGRVTEIARGFGIRNKLADGPAFALGTSESTLLEMTGAYAGILAGGKRVAPYGLVEIRLSGDRTPILSKSESGGERVISEDVSRELVRLMHGVVEGGTGIRARLEGWQAAGKTGTSQDAKDAWFIGFTADYVAGVWMGYDDNTPLRGVTGGGLPAEIWRETMARIHEGREPAMLPMSAEDAGASSDPRRDGEDPQEERRRTVIDLIAELFGAGG